MATYCYQNQETEESIDRSYPMGDAPEFILLEDGTLCKRHRAAEFAAQGGQKSSTWPMKSIALAVHPTQRKQYTDFAKEQGVPTDFDKMGHPVFRTKKHRKNYSELVGATDFDGGYGDPRCD